MAKKRDKNIAIKVVELILAAFIAKGLGFVREMVLANYYGTSYVSDAFVAVQNIPAIIFTVFGTAVTTGFIPLYTEIKVKKNKELADRFANNVFNIFCLLSVFLTILGVLFSNQLVKFRERLLSYAINLQRLLCLHVLPLFWYIYIMRICKLRAISIKTL